MSHRRHKSRRSRPGHHGASAKWRFFRTPAAIGIVVLVALCVLALARWRTSPPPTAATPTRDNILLITLDTVRADRLGSYGYQRARTRHLDRLAAEGVRFERAYTTAPITLPAHASILSGLYPFEHGVRNNGNFYLPDRVETLATALSKFGYRTGAFVGAFVLDRRYGLARGFDVYDDRMRGPQAQVVSLEAERRGDYTSQQLTAWLDEQSKSAGRPFFAWLHLYDAHEPYHPPQPFKDAFADSPYDGEIAFTDAIVASVLDKLRQLGLYDNTIVAIVADHGESLGDHGEETHSMFVYDAAIRVPLILWRPGRLPAGRVIPEPVRVTDLPLTLLDLVGAPPLPAKHGRTLLPLIEGRRLAETSAYAETYLPQLYLNWAPLRSLRDDRWKYIEAPKPELYDTVNDPGERRNLIDEQRPRADAMRGALERLTGGGHGSMAAGTLDREAQERLAALGYIAAAAEAPSDAAEGSRRDPKDMIALFNQLRRANSAVRDRRFAEALPILGGVLQEDPRNAFAQLVLGSAYMGMGDYRRAIEQYRRYVDLVPTSSYAHQWMAICYVRLGDQDQALREADAALLIDPRATDARILRGGILASRGQYDLSLSELREAVAIDPAKVMVRLDLAKVLDEAGRRQEAEREYEAIIAQQPDYTPALTGLGALLASAGDLPRATDLFKRALTIDPTLDAARFNLGRVLEQQQRTAEAAAEYQRLVESPSTAESVRTAARQRLHELRAGS
jgi:arylsulfatase A-like enzyme/thioredoxin-like negative regulator of GroEL